jgi:nucleoid-associated protein YgaU
MSKTKLSSSEWQLVKDAPYWVNAALEAAEGRSALLTKRRESKALEKAVNGYNSENALVRDIIADDSKPAKEIDDANQSNAENALSKIADIVEEKLGGEDLDALNDFLLSVGRSVAGAAGEGILGMGEKVSKKEAAALEAKANEDAEARARAEAKAKQDTEARKKEQEKRARDAREQAERMKREAQKAREEKQAAAKAEAEKYIAEHEVVPGDNLSMISQKYYGAQSHWPKIYEANKEIIGDNPSLIRPGQRLRIPKLDT